MTCRKTKTNLERLKQINEKEKEKKRVTTTTKERKKTKAEL
jgi:hypothetical protein